MGPAVTLPALLVVAASALAANRMDEERLVNLDSPYTTGFTKTRFDFQHAWEDGDLNPIADLTLIFGAWRTVDLQAEFLPHNLKARAFDRIVEFQSNSWEGAVKWQMFNQHAGDPLALAVSAHFWRYDALRRYTNLDPKSPEYGARSRRAYHFNSSGAQIIASYDAAWIGPTVVLKRYHRDLKPLGAGTEDYTIPGAGAWVRLYRRKDVLLHALGDYHAGTVEAPGARDAWGLGLRLMYHSPHIYTLFVTNASGDLWEESIYGTDHRIYAFRWSYKF